MTIEQMIQAKQALIEFNAAAFIYFALACMVVSILVGVLLKVEKINDDLAAVMLVVCLLLGPITLVMGICYKIGAPIQARAEVANYGLIEMKR
jgi:hypothetical protein